MEEEGFVFGAARGDVSGRKEEVRSDSKGPGGPVAPDRTFNPEQAVEGHGFSFAVTIQPDCGLIHDADCKWSVESRE